MPQLIEQELITSKDDILKLDIIDFNRLNGHFANTLHALDTIFSWFDHAATYSIIDFSDIFWNVPSIDGWQKWNHVGNHENIGRQYYNFFRHYFDGYIQFDDSPDFQGKINDSYFWGDIGKVSSSTFAFIQKHMKQNDLWISIPNDGNVHILIELQKDYYNSVFT